MTLSKQLTELHVILQDSIQKLTNFSNFLSENQLLPEQIHLKDQKIQITEKQTLQNDQFFDQKLIFYQNLNRKSQKQPEIKNLTKYENKILLKIKLPQRKFQKTYFSSEIIKDPSLTKKIQSQPNVFLHSYKLQLIQYQQSYDKMTKMMQVELKDEILEEVGGIQEKLGFTFIQLLKCVFDVKRKRPMKLEDVINLKTIVNEKQYEQQINSSEQ